MHLCFVCMFSAWQLLYSHTLNHLHGPCFNRGWLDQVAQMNRTSIPKGGQTKRLFDTSMPNIHTYGNTSMFFCLGQLPHTQRFGSMPIQGSRSSTALTCWICSVPSAARAYQALHNQHATWLDFFNLFNFSMFDDCIQCLLMVLPFCFFISGLALKVVGH